MEDLKDLVIELQSKVISLLDKNEQLVQAIGKTGAYAQELDKAFAKALNETNQRIDALVGPRRNGPAPVPHVSAE